MKLTIKEIAAAVHAEAVSAPENLEITGIEFDSRKIQSGDIFLPLKGARDGHEFIATAFENGAVAIFSEKEIPQPHILVEDCLAAFQALASVLLEKSSAEVIAVTGSNGKTTTKDMIAAVLSEKFVTYKTQGNHNNEIGLPYTVAHMPEGTEKLVLEMGMDHPGDIDFLSKLAKPHLAVITLIGEAHLEFMGSREAIAKGKMGITAGLDGLLMAPADPIINEFIPENQKIVRFGLPGNELYITKMLEHKDFLSFEVNFLDEELTIPVPGRYNATNAMLAAYVGQYYGLTESDIKDALRQVELTRNRTEWLRAANGAEILSDVYNSNPTAVRLILETFQSLPKNENGRKIVVLADMLELGESAPELHASIADTLDLTEIDAIYLYGPLMKHLADRIPTAKHFESLSALTEKLSADSLPTDQILIKGSNSMGLQTIVEELTE